MSKPKRPLEGEGLKVVGFLNRPWYGPGYCGICGDRGDDLVPVAVRWWCPDDGWKMGVLCSGCMDDARDRGPREGDYALMREGECDLGRDEKIDTLAELGCLDSAYSETALPSQGG